MLSICQGHVIVRTYTINPIVNILTVERIQRVLIILIPATVQVKSDPCALRLVPRIVRASHIL